VTKGRDGAGLVSEQTLHGKRCGKEKDKIHSGYEEIGTRQTSPGRDRVLEGVHKECDELSPKKIGETR